MSLNARTLVTAASILTILSVFTYVPANVAVETFTGLSTLPCYTTTTLVPFGTWTLYTLSLCSCTLVQSQSYASRYVETVTCPVAEYTSTRGAVSPLALAPPWLPILLLLLGAACVGVGVYAMVRRHAIG